MAKYDAKTVDVEKPAVKTARANPLLADDRTISVGGALVFATGVRGLAEEMAARLSAEVSGPLAEMEGAVADPNAGRLLASSRRLRSHVEDVQRDLRALSAAAGTMAQDTVA